MQGKGMEGSWGNWVEGEKDVGANCKERKERTEKESGKKGEK